MSASHQPSFAPNEFVYRWLSRTNSQPCEDERDQPHDILDAISPMQHDHRQQGICHPPGSQSQVVLTRMQEEE